MKIPKSINIRFLLGMLDHIKFIVCSNRLGLLKPPEQAAETEEHTTSYVLVMDGLTPSLIAVDSLMVLIKKRVPVIEYSGFVERHRALSDDEDVDMEMDCSVCLNCVEKSHEIRELCNCYHGQVTCPLCRTLLFPAKTERII
ncbi:hypothetical protein RGQ29_013441 [Quercus rubra]|uniref:RING-type domain-containing protein n=1 Tax=Quercus rubra TaxID=3512 RepID=A0AAN7JC22_QUERU|nr:hypothetical protein RGQ29_013441 [Quercus rubra]